MCVLTKSVTIQDKVFGANKQSGNLKVSNCRGGKSVTEKPDQASAKLTRTKTAPLN